MINKISLSNFRGFKRFSCGDFAPITIVGGRNNSGKSSLLEAIALLSDFSRSTVLTDLSTYRGFPSPSFSDLESVFHNARRDDPITLLADMADGSQRSFQLSYLLPSTVLMQAADTTNLDDDLDKTMLGFERYEEAFRFVDAANSSGRSYAEKLYLYTQGGDATGFTFTRKANAAQICGRYLSASQARLLDEPSLKELFLTQEKSQIESALRRVDKRIQGVELFQNKFYAKVQDSARMIPLSSLGDGMLKIVKILTAVIVAQPGWVLAIDEIENGLHFSAMSAFWKALVSEAIARKVQLVVSTHNLEMMSAMSDAVDKDRLADFRYIRLEYGADGQIVPIAYDASAFSTHLRVGAELRG